MQHDQLVTHLKSLGIPFGQEQSIKWLHGKLLANRSLVGVDLSHISVQTVWDIASEWGMPNAAKAPLLARVGAANAIFFAVEPDDGSCTYKIYLEFWDAVCARVRETRAPTPLLLHFGVKWNTATPGQFAQARYTCFPLLESSAVLQRMAHMYGAISKPGSARFANAIVQHALGTKGETALIYMEATEDGNKRLSFDINLYKTQIYISNVLDYLKLTHLYFDIPSESFDAAVAPLHSCALGHLSGGLDRHGNEFMTIYAEKSPRS